MTTCPHCNRPIHSITKHVPACHKNPSAHAATLAALDDGTGAIVSQNAYERRRGPGSIGVSTLIGQVGAWPQVAETFGLKFVRHTPGSQPGTKPTRSHPLNAPLTYEERHACALRAQVEVAW